MKTRKELENLLIEYGRLMGNKNLTPGTSGNMSFRYGDKILITTSGTANGFLKHDDFCLIDYDGNAVSGEVGKPSSEKLLHTAIYRKRQDLNVILHVHSPYLCTFASAGIELDKPVMAEITYYFGKIPLAEYALPSTRKLAENTVKFFDEYDAVLMANHGFVVASKTIEDAYQKLELAESYAQVVFNTHLLGGAKLLTEAQKNEILALRN